MVSWYLKSSQVPHCRHVSVNQPALTSACKQSAVTKPATLQGKQLEMSGVNIQTQKKLILLATLCMGVLGAARTIFAGGRSHFERSFSYIDQ